jgi:GDP-L-fucose synthase
MALNGHNFEIAGKRVWVAGHRGMVGSALMRRLAGENCELLAVGHASLDLRRQTDVEQWMQSARPQVVVIAAARVGGILGNSRRPAEFLYDNIAMQTNIIDCASGIGVEKLLFLGSSCVYPRLAPQPIPEDSLLTSALEPTNQWYSIAKIAGIMQCQAYREQYGCDFISAMPTNLYGPGDNFDLEGSHVLPALLRRFHTAKLEGRPDIMVWGTGTPRREFLHVDDCADALVFLLKSYSEADTVNIGTGTDLTIAELAQTIADVVGYKGSIVFDPSKPDGTPRKLLDVGRLSARGWNARIGLREGILSTFAWYRDQLATSASLRGFAGAGDTATDL